MCTKFDGPSSNSLFCLLFTGVTDRPTARQMPVSYHYASFETPGLLARTDSGLSIQKIHLQWTINLYIDDTLKILMSY